MRRTMAKPMTKTEWMNWLEKAWDEAQQREWVGLTDEEVSEIIRKEIGFNSCFGPEESFAHAIEAKLKEKNG